MMTQTNYNIKNDSNGKQVFASTITWIDNTGKKHTVDSTDISEAQTIIGLLSGDICQADLEP